MKDITYCADAEYCPNRHKCIRADVPKWEEHISLSNLYQEHILSCKEERCQHYIPKLEQYPLTKGYQK